MVAARHRTATRALPPLVALGAAVGAFELVVGFVYPAVALSLEQRGASAALIGAQAAMVGLGLTASALLVPWLCGRLGAVRLGLGNLGVASLAILGFGLIDHVGVWFGLGLIVGITANVWYVQSETWLNQLADARRRGRAVGMVVGLRQGAFACGPLLIPVLGVGSAPFALMAALVAASGLSLGRLRSQVDRSPAPGLGELLTLGRTLPVLLLAVAAAGWFEGAVVPLWVVHALDQGATRDQATSTLTVIVIGTAALQLPIGWLADRGCPDLVLTGCALGTALIAALLPSLDLTHAATWPLLLAWGGLGCAAPTLALVTIGHQLNGTRLTVATAAIAVTWGVGALFGAALTGQAMTSLGALGLPASIAVVFIAVGGLTLRLPARREASPIQVRGPGG